MDMTPAGYWLLGGYLLTTLGVVAGVGWILKKKRRK